jgi:uncharacterized protein
MLDADVRAAAQKSVLCWLATVAEDGQPNVSPKEVFCIHDAEHLVIASIASPASVRNIRANPLVCVSFIDVFAQRGCKVMGSARYIARADAAFSALSAELAAMAGPRFPLHGVILVRAHAVETIVAPSYRLHPAETTVQSQAVAAMRTYGVRPADPGS